MSRSAKVSNLTFDLRPSTCDLRLPVCDVSDCPRGWNKLLSDRVTGAHALGFRALRLAIASKFPIGTLKRCFQILASAHSAMALLHNIAEQVSRADSLRRLRAIERRLRTSSAAIARNFQKELRSHFPRRFDLAVVTFSNSSTVVEALARSRKRIARLYIARSLPLGEGGAALKTARRKRLPAELMEDNKLTHMLKLSDLAVVGADSILEDGTVVNKVGTNSLARTCARLDKPFWVAASAYKRTIKRHVSLFQKVGNQRIKLFDLTSPQLVDLVVTEEK